MGRFVNADEPKLIKLNDNVLSHNYFSYCNDNPISEKDLDGFGQWSKWLDILDYSIIHNMVANRVALQVGILSKREMYVFGSLGNGRVDVYDFIMNSYYEVKSLGVA